MRVTIAHSKTKAEAIQTVDRAMLDVFQILAAPPLTISNAQKTWNGSVMMFSLTAQMGFVKNAVSGTVEVTERDVTIDADLGLLSRFFPEKKVRTMLESRVRGLLK